MHLGHDVVELIRHAINAATIAAVVWAIAWWSKPAPPPPPTSIWR